MKSAIEAKLEFSFKGETHRISEKVDLDDMMRRFGAIQDLHHLLALKSKIDTYSYLYEVMEMQPVAFDNPEGLAVECLSDGNFDIPQFEQLWRESRLTKILAEIAQNHLSINDLDQHPDIRAALEAAYRSGKQA